MFKDALKRLTCDLSKAKPLEHPWVIRRSGASKGGN